MIESGPPTRAPNSKFAHTIALLPELGKMSRKQIAALVGLAPYDFDSGTNGQNRSLPCGEGLGVGVGVAVSGHTSCNNRYPPPQPSPNASRACPTCAR